MILHAKGGHAMDFHSADIDRRLTFFSELFSNDSHCYLWTYTPDGILLHTNCQDPVVEKLFQSNGCYNYMIEYASERTQPLMMSNSLSMVWGAVFELKDGWLNRIHVMGPVFTQTISNSELEKAVWDKTSPKRKARYMKSIMCVPVLSFTVFLRRILMMQYCVTGEHLQISDIVMQRPKKKTAKHDPKDAPDDGIYADRIQVYMAEQSLLNMIRSGDLDYQDVLQKSARFFTGKQRFSANALQHAKLGQVQFVALCCSAALEGGVSSEVAYSRKDAYIQDIENAKSLSEITEIGKTMYTDYITLVHRQHVNPAYSKEIQSTCDFIENHLREKLTAQDLASRIGYSGYYLSRWFKKETGFSIDEYARNAKVERAKRMLVTTQDSIQDIADSLGFAGRNYFASTFRKITGMPPAAYRKKYQKY